MQTIDGENEVKILTIPQLKTWIQAECNSFNKHSQKEAYDHCVETNVSTCFQVINDGAVLLKKHKHQAFVMQFEDRRLRCNVVALTRKKLSSKSDVIAILSEEAFAKVIDEELNETQFIDL